MKWSPKHWRWPPRLAKRLANAFGWLRRTVDSATVSQDDRTRMQGIFRDVLRYELLFWEMACQGEDWPE